MNKLKIFVIITALVIIMIYVCSRNLPNIKKHYAVEYNKPMEIQDELKNDSVSNTNTEPKRFEEPTTTANPLDFLRKRFNCENRRHLDRIAQRGEFWVIYNWIKGQHGEVQCHDAITLTTHGDYTFLQNLRPLTERWDGPLSVAVHAPGSDLNTTLTVIKQARYCNPLIKKWVSFHAFFHQEHLPPEIPKLDDNIEPDYTFNCTDFETMEHEHNNTYTAQHGLEYPVNVARNIARDSALTHLVLAIDIELYPSPGMAQAVLQMIAKDPPILKERERPYVFTLPEFEIDKRMKPPANKTELLKMLNKTEAILMHLYVCPPCHRIPYFKEWCAQEQTPEMEILGAGKRADIFTSWEAIHIGPRNRLPSYDERITWEAKRNKMSQAYILCLLDYDFLVLNNAFLTHKPGIKFKDYSISLEQRLANTTKLLKKIALYEYRILYGITPGCFI